MATVPESADAALAALALVEACNADNQINREAIINGTGAPHLVLGLVVLASSLRAALATSLDLAAEAVDEELRAMYLTHAGGE